MTRVLTRAAANLSDVITIRDEGVVRSLRVRLIRYLMVDDHYVVYHSREGVFREYITLAQAEKKLSDPAFFRIDRGCLVNLRFVTLISRDTCTVDGEELLIARTQRSQFQRAYAAFLSGCRGG